MVATPRNSNLIKNGPVRLISIQNHHNEACKNKTIHLNMKDFSVALTSHCPPLTLLFLGVFPLEEGPSK